LRTCFEPVEQLGNKHQFVYLQRFGTVQKVLEVKAKALGANELVTKLLDQIQILHALFEAYGFLQRNVRQVNVVIARIEHDQHAEHSAIGQRQRDVFADLIEKYVRLATNQARLFSVQVALALDALKYTAHNFVEPKRTCRFQIRWHFSRCVVRREFP
jgi:hypothetical protein